MRLCSRACCMHAYGSSLSVSRTLPAHLPRLLISQIEFLEVRLAEVMAYADIPPSMRPALSEFDPVAAITGVTGRCVRAVTPHRTGAPPLPAGEASGYGLLMMEEAPM